MKPVVNQNSYRHIKGRSGVNKGNVILAELSEALHGDSKAYERTDKLLQELGLPEILKALVIVHPNILGDAIELAEKSNPCISIQNALDNLLGDRDYTTEHHIPEIYTDGKQIDDNPDLTTSIQPYEMRLRGDFVPVKRAYRRRPHSTSVTATLFCDLPREKLERIDGTYRKDDPFEGSHVHEHYVSTLNGDS